MRLGTLQSEANREGGRAGGLAGSACCATGKTDKGQAVLGKEIPLLV